MRPNRLSLIQLLAAMLIVVAVLLNNTGRAGGSEGDPGSNIVLETQSGPGGPTIVLTGSDGTEVEIGASMPQWLRACTWQTVSAAAAAVAATAGTTESAPPPDSFGEDRWAVIYCPPSPEALAYQPGVALNGVLASWPLAERPPQLVLDWITARAVAMLRVPVLPVVSAPVGTAAEPMITHVPSWFWIDPSSWSAVRISAPEVFGVVVEVTATPTNLRVGNDAGWQGCRGAGRPFMAGAGDRGACTLGFEHSSSTGPKFLRAQVRWSVAYECSAHCGGAFLAPVVIESRRPVAVGELQALSMRAEGSG